MSSDNRRKHVLIDRKFQLKTVLFINILCFIAFSIYPIFIYALTQKMASQQLIDPNFSSSFFKNIFLYFLGFQILFQIFISIMLIFYTHKVAGPIYKTINFLYELINGNPDADHNFRQSDFFMQLSIPLSELKDKHIRNQALIKQISKELGDLSDKSGQDYTKGAVQSIREKLLELH